MINKQKFVLDVDSNNNGSYQLNAVLIHKGRSSSSGHHVALFVQNQSKEIIILRVRILARTFDAHFRLELSIQTCGPGQFRSGLFD